MRQKPNAWNDSLDAGHPNAHYSHQLMFFPRIILLLSVLVATVPQVAAELTSVEVGHTTYRTYSSSIPRFLSWVSIVVEESEYGYCKRSCLGKIVEMSMEKRPSFYKECLARCLEDMSIEFAKWFATWYVIDMIIVSHRSLLLVPRLIQKSCASMKV